MKERQMFYNPTQVEPLTLHVLILCLGKLRLKVKDLLPNSQTIK